MLLQVYCKAIKWAYLATLKHSLEYIEEEMRTNDTIRKGQFYKKHQGMSAISFTRGSR